MWMNFMLRLILLVEFGGFAFLVFLINKKGLALAKIEILWSRKNYSDAYGLFFRQGYPNLGDRRGV